MFGRRGGEGGGGGGGGGEFMYTTQHYFISRVHAAAMAMMPSLPCTSLVREYQVMYVVNAPQVYVTCYRGRLSLSPLCSSSLLC